MVKAVQSGCFERALDDQAAGIARFEDAGDGENGLAAKLLQLAPFLHRAASKGNIGRVLEIGEPDNPALSM